MYDQSNETITCNTQCINIASICKKNATRIQNASINVPVRYIFKMLLAPT